MGGVPEVTNEAFFVHAYLKRCNDEGREPNPTAEDLPISMASYWDGMRQLFVLGLLKNTVTMLDDKGNKTVVGTF